MSVSSEKISEKNSITESIKNKNCELFKEQFDNLKKNKLTEMNAGIIQALLLFATEYRANEILKIILSEANEYVIKLDEKMLRDLLKNCIHQRVEGIPKLEDITPFSPYEQMSCIDLLLNANANPYLGCEEGASPFDIAILAGNESILRMILRKVPLQNHLLFLKKAIHSKQIFMAHTIFELSKNHLSFEELNKLLDEDLVSTNGLMITLRIKIQVTIEEKKRKGIVPIVQSILDEKPNIEQISQQSDSESYFYVSYKSNDMEFCLTLLKKELLSLDTQYTDDMTVLMKLVTAKVDYSEEQAAKNIETLMNSYPTDLSLRDKKTNQSVLSLALNVTPVNPYLCLRLIDHYQRKSLHLRDTDITQFVLRQQEINEAFETNGIREDNRLFLLLYIAKLNIDLYHKERTFLEASENTVIQYRFPKILPIVKLIIQDSSSCYRSQKICISIENLLAKTKYQKAFRQLLNKTPTLRDIKSIELTFEEMWNLIWSFMDSISKEQMIDQWEPDEALLSLYIFFGTEQVKKMIVMESIKERVQVLISQQKLLQDNFTDNQMKIESALPAIEKYQEYINGEFEEADKIANKLKANKDLKHTNFVKNVQLKKASSENDKRSLQKIMPESIKLFPRLLPKEDPSKPVDQKQNKEQDNKEKVENLETTLKKVSEALQKFNASMEGIESNIKDPSIQEKVKKAEAALDVLKTETKCFETWLYKLNGETTGLLRSFKNFRYIMHSFVVDEKNKRKDLFYVRGKKAESNAEKNKRENDEEALVAEASKKAIKIYLDKNLLAKAQEKSRQGSEEPLEKMDVLEITRQENTVKDETRKQESTEIDDKINQEQTENEKKRKQEQENLLKQKELEAEKQAQEKQNREKRAELSELQVIANEKAAEADTMSHDLYILRRQQEEAVLLLRERPKLAARDKEFEKLKAKTQRFDEKKKKEEENELERTAQMALQAIITSKEARMDKANQRAAQVLGEIPSSILKQYNSYRALTSHSNNTSSLIGLDNAPIYDRLAVISLMVKAIEKERGNSIEYLDIERTALRYALADLFEELRHLKHAYVDLDLSNKLRHLLFKGDHKSCYEEDDLKQSKEYNDALLAIISDLIKIIPEFTKGKMVVDKTLAQKDLLLNISHPLFPKLLQAAECLPKEELRPLPSRLELMSDIERCNQGLELNEDGLLNPHLRELALKGYVAHRSICAKLMKIGYFSSYKDNAILYQAYIEAGNPLRHTRKDAIITPI